MREMFREPRELEVILDGLVVLESEINDLKSAESF